MNSELTDYLAGRVCQEAMKDWLKKKKKEAVQSFCFNHFKGTSKNNKNKEILHDDFGKVCIYLTLSLSSLTVPSSKGLLYIYEAALFLVQREKIHNRLWHFH